MREICAAEILLSTQIDKALRRKRTSSSKFSERQDSRASRLLNDQFNKLVSGGSHTESD